MAYLGAQPNKTLTKTTSQSFNGTGSATVFTLNRAVNTGEELEVFVENVQQEPGSGKSYTASGTTLTFDEAPPSGTGNIYVIYRGLAEVTTRLEHDANQALSATTGTFSGAVSGTNGTFTGDLTVDTNTLFVDAANNRVGVNTILPSQELHVVGDADTSIMVTSTSGGYSSIQFGDANDNVMGAVTYNAADDSIEIRRHDNVTGLRIDASGRGTMPSQPGASAGLSASQASGSTIVAGHVHHNVGNHYNSSTGVFTCPVGGRYLVSIFAMGNSGSNYTLDIQLKRNNADYQGLVPYNSASGGFHNQVGGMAIVNCSANDTLKFHNGSGGSLYGTSNGRHSCLNFYLLG